MPDLLFTTADGRWRVYQTRARTGFDLVERHPGGGVRTHLEDVSLTRIGEFLAGQGVDPQELREA